MTSEILDRGRNCWRIEQASRAAFLIDADEYFARLATVLERAERSIFILGWDLDQRTVLASGDPPRRVGDLLNSLAARRPRLRIHVLIWDFAMIYAFQRDWLSILGSSWNAHPRVRFELDGHHALGASHHQKVVVVDDRAAFVGGIDITKRRWDTAEHRADDARRVDPSGAPYPPIHDVQVLVEGDAARALGDLARDRWRRATGTRAAPFAPGETDHWPDDLRPDLEDVDVAIARTVPRHGRRPEIREVESLHVDAIMAARRSIYIENQYLTSSVVADSLTRRLRETDGPEVVVVLPKSCPGWLEQSTIGALRGRVLRTLREADRRGRLRIVYPKVSGLDDGPLVVHAKVMIVDDRFVKVGSSNLSNRSMGVDTECDLAVEANDECTEAAIRNFRCRLLAEHVGSSLDRIDQATRSRGLVETVDEFRGAERRLEPVPDEPDSVVHLVPDSAIVDPETPIPVEEIGAVLAAAETGDEVDDDGDLRRPARRMLLKASVFLSIVLGLAWAWQRSPLGEWIVPERLAAWLGGVSDLPWAPFVVIGVFVAGAAVLLPLTVLTAASGVVFGPILGFVYAYPASFCAAVAGYGVGRLLRPDTIRSLAGARLNRLSLRLARRGVLAVVVLRLLPAAPFTVVNLVLGASHVRLRDFALGSAIGLVPATAATTVLAGQFMNVVRRPEPHTIVLAFGLLAVVLAGAAWVYLRFSRGPGSQEGRSPSRTAR